jgi:ribonuclease BN (tRNA processing enzyme)
LAKHAHTLFCEAAFSEADVAHATANGHLTTRACGEIATAAGVARLVPFHFSRRYADDPQPLYEELRTACANVVVPRVSEGEPLPASASPEQALSLETDAS